MLPRIRETLALILIALLPFHALFVTVATKLIAGPGHAPLPMLALWKEAILGVILLCTIIEILWNRDAASRLREEKKQSLFRLDGIDMCILLGMLYALILEFLKNYSLFIFHYSFVIGFKYDFLPLVAFFILRRVSWSAWFQQTVIKVLLITGVIIALYGIATFFLPMRFFVWLGYSDLHSLYQAQGPLAAFQQIGGSSLRRIQSTMSGPNQLGVWMLIPLGVIISSVYTKKVFSIQYRVLSISFLIVALVMTMSRAAWIGAGVMIAVMLWQRVHRKSLVVWWFTGLVVLAGIAIALAPQILIRKQSLIGHIEKPLVALQTIIAHPFGLGLGSAGPASNRTSDTCIDQPIGSDISWAKDRQDLCIFIGSEQAQPVNRTCTCPLLTENWYLQWGVEMGWVGLMLSMLLPFFVLRKLRMNNEKLKMNNYSLPAPRSLGEVGFIIHYSFIAIAVASLFLHAWEDSAVALTVWVLLSLRNSSQF